jgi:hypothetical protein
MAEPAIPVFKKRQPKGGLRKNRAVDSNSLENGEDDDAEQIRLIAELREEQKDRQRKSGIEASKLMSASGMY